MPKSIPGFVSKPPGGVCRVISYSQPVPYDVALAAQYRLAKDRYEGLVPDTVLLLEHPPTITLGRRTREADLLTSREALDARGILVVESDRGGEITYHCPGQLVAYPIFDLRSHGQDLHFYIRGLEEVVIRALSDLGIVGERIPSLTGVWVNGAKIAAIGIKVSRWISLHGLAVNIDADLAPMREDLVPCGIKDRGVTSLAELLPAAPQREFVQELLIAAISSVFGANIERYDQDSAIGRGIIAQ
jgi:lipoyl(octanoyl) transferase